MRPSIGSYRPLPWHLEQRMRRPVPLEPGAIVTTVVAATPPPGAGATFAVSRATAGAQPLP